LSWGATAYVKSLTAGENGERISRSEKLVLFVMADSFNDDRGYAWPSIVTLAQSALLSERQVRYCLRGLERKGLLATEKGNGRSHGSRYTFPVYKPKGANPAPFPPTKGAIIPAPFTQEKGQSRDLKGAKSPHEKGQNQNGKGAIAIAPEQEEPPDGTPIKPPEEQNLASAPSAEAGSQAPGPGPENQEFPDARHGTVRDAVRTLQRHLGGAEVWDGSAGTTLAHLLRARRDWPCARLLRCVANRFASPEVNHLEHPRKWLRSLSNYAGGPLDRYGKPARQFGSQAEDLFHLLQPGGNGRSRATRTRAPLVIPPGAVSAHECNPWPRVLEALRSGLDPQSFATWVKPVRLLYTHQGQLCLGVPTADFAHWFEEHLRTRLPEAIQAASAGSGAFSVVNLEEHQGRAA
jgi:hypothetical protein